MLPNVDNFLKYFANLYNIVLFSAGSYEYINAAIENFNINSFTRVFTQKDCDGPSNDLRKDLTKITTDLKRLIMIDDSFAAVREYISNVVCTIFL
ncbi:hypothetical protein B4U79_18318 [Dinothrombium tinctorium]|uniref:Mitochondrial import inner membrane translocase subunit TIM50 n=1 Tax=Dinothrombium tinctorium TaxID=1965070 RepID=A0A443QQN0_9ACAR|nr:hypothetical protein B4U79_18318 [Dinothrombium tinctorium]